MRYDPAAVRQILTMLEPGPAPAAEAERLAGLLGSWGETLAHLLLRRDSFAAYPEIAEAMQAWTAVHASGPATPRPPGADMRRLTATALALEEALGAVLAAERERLPVSDRADAAWRAYAGERPAAGQGRRLSFGEEAR